jgi:hypothetical protein
MAYLRGMHLSPRGMHFDAHLAGLLMPRHSYFVALPHPPRLPPVEERHGSVVGHKDNDNGGGVMESPNLPNFLTLGFSHDWCVKSDFVWISKEDHFSGLK